MVSAGLGETASVWIDLKYLERPSEANRLDDATFRRWKRPVGSGAIEIEIRRVINLGMKGNSIFGRKTMRGVLLLRGLVPCHSLFFG